MRELLGNASIYHSGLVKEEKERNLLEFALSKTRVLVAVDGLNEGVDIKGADAAICASGVSTELTNTQQLGRIIRPEDGKRPLFINIYTEETVERN